MISIPILINIKCYPILGVILSHYISINLFYFWDIKKIIINMRRDDLITNEFRYFQEEEYWYLFRFIQISSFLLGIIVIICLSVNIDLCIERSDRQMSILFYFFSNSLIIITQIFLKKYKNTSISVQYSLNLFIDIIKGKIDYQMLEECAICLEEKKESVEVVVLNCKHIFHYKCLNECFLNNINKCPLCRTVFI